MGFLDSFLNPGAKDIKRGAKKADQFYTQGLEDALPHYEQAGARLDPYAQTGTQANAMYSAALGLNGPEAQQAFIDNYLEDPTQDLAYQAVARQMASRGMTDSGASRLAAARVWREGYGDRLNRMFGASQQGQQAAGQQGQFDVGTGDLKFGTSQLRANNQINRANALATSRQAGVNNLLDAAGTAVKAFAPRPV